MAYSLPMGQYVQGSITSGGLDVLYDFSLNAEEYVFVILGAGSSGGTLADPYARLYESSYGFRTTIAWDDNSGPGQGDALIQRTLSAGGPYSIGVTAADNVQTGTFTIWYAPTAYVRMGATPGDNPNIAGTAGNDVIDGLGGKDTMKGGAGNDTYYVNQSNDVVVENTSAGNDTIRSEASYTLKANIENLSLTGSGNTRANGNELKNSLCGNTGNNILDGKAGADTMAGGAGNDIYYVDNTGDKTIETSTLIAEIDTVQSSVTRSLGLNLENLTLTGAAAIDGTGNALNNILTGNTAANTLKGGAGNDTLKGGAGIDTMSGGTGNDTYYVDTAGDITTETSTLVTEIDTVQSSVNRALGDNLENLTLTGTAIDGTGNALNNILTGNATANTLDGRAGNDTLNGGAGIDTMSGGAGNDTYYVDNTNDITTETSTLVTEIDTVYSSVTRMLGDNLENLTLTGAATIDGTGNGLNNILNGNNAVNRLEGLAGNDTYYVDNAGDVVIEATGSGKDKVNSSVSVNVLWDNVENLTLTGAAAIDGTGNALSNSMTGNSAANTLDGGLGNDTLNGGAGADTLIGGAGNDIYFVDDNGFFGGVGDIVTEALNSGTDTVYSSVTCTLANNVEKLTLIGAANIGGTGNILDNTITSNAGANRVKGGDGNDTIMGSLGEDTLEGGNGADVFVYGSIDEIFQLDSNAYSGYIHDDLYDFTSGEDKIDFSAIDADINTAGDQAFSLITGGLTGAAGQLLLTNGALEGDINGDGSADFILTTGFGCFTTSLSDYIL